jgi:FtsH-binding integral membrane protein
MTMSETRKIQLIVGLLVWISILVLIVHLTHQPVSEGTRLVFVSAFTSLVTLLLAKLGQRNNHP